MKPYLKELLKDTLHPLAVPVWIGFLLFLPLVVISMFDFLLPEPLFLFHKNFLGPFLFSAAFFFFGLSGFQSIKRKEAVSRNGKLITGKSALISGWIRLVAFWGVGFYMAILLLKNLLEVIRLWLPY